MKKKTTAQISDFQPSSRPHQTLHSLPFFALLAFFIVSVLLCFFFASAASLVNWKKGNSHNREPEPVWLLAIYQAHRSPFPPAFGPLVFALARR